MENNNCIDIENKLLIRIHNKLFIFKSALKCSEYFNDNNNINNLNGLLTNDMLYILQKDYIINRIIACLKNKEQEFLIKQKTKDKYLNIPNFKIEKY